MQNFCGMSGSSAAGGQQNVCCPAAILYYDRSRNPAECVMTAALKRCNDLNFAENILWQSLHSNT